jgi:streptogramin lyase
MRHVTALLALAISSGASAQVPVDGHPLQCHGLPKPGSGATIVAIASDKRVWFTQSSGNRLCNLRFRSLD